MTSQTSPFRRATWDGMSSGVDFLNPFSSEAQETIPVWDALDLSPGKWMLRNHWTSKKNREQKLHMMKKMGNCESAEEGVGPDPQPTACNHKYKSTHFADPPRAKGKKLTIPKSCATRYISHISQESKRNRRFKGQNPVRCIILQEARPVAFCGSISAITFEPSYSNQITLSDMQGLRSFQQ